MEKTFFKMVWGVIYLGVWGLVYNILATVKMQTMGAIAASQVENSMIPLMSMTTIATLSPYLNILFFMGFLYLTYRMFYNGRNKNNSGE